MRTYFDAILQNDATEDEAIEYASGFDWSECGTQDEDLRYIDHITTVNGVDVYYCFGANHYLFGPASE